MRNFIVLHEAVEIWRGKAEDEQDALDKSGIEIIEEIKKRKVKK